MARLQGAATEDAADAVQEAMLRAAEHPEIADDRLQAWLVAVTTRLCIDDHRRRVNEVSRWKRASGQAVIEQPEQAVEDEACERSEAAWVASLATELLPPRQARALELAAAGCDVQQVATNLGVRYRAAESLLARARRTIRTAISASLGVAAWTWRSQLPGVSGNVVPVGLASAAAAAIVVIIPPVVSSPAPAGPAPMAPSTSRLEPAVSGTQETGGRSIRRAPGPPTVSPPESRIEPNVGTAPASRQAAPPPLLPLPRVQAPTAQLPPALPRSGPLSPPTLPKIPDVQHPLKQIPPRQPELDQPELDRVVPITPPVMPPLERIPSPNPDDIPRRTPELGVPSRPGKAESAIVSTR